MRFSIGAKVMYNPPYELYYSEEVYRFKMATVIQIGKSRSTIKFADGRKINTQIKSLTAVKNLQLMFPFMY